MAIIKYMTNLLKQKREACIRNDIESMPYKYRDLRSMFLYGIGAWEKATAQEINEYFKEYKLKITKEDKEWASYNKE